MRSANGVAAGLLLACVAAGQGKVWVVDQGLGPGFDTASLPTAVSNAANGDTILVRSGIYSGFAVLGKGFAVIAEAGATVVVQPPVNFPSTVEELAPSDVLILRGLDLQGFSVGLSPGLAWIEDCRMQSQSFGVPGFSAILSDHVVLQRCTMNGLSGSDCSGGCLFPASEGMFVASSDVHLERCTAQGGVGLGASSAFLPAGQAGAPGAVQHGGRLWIAGSSFTGGAGGAGFDDTSGTGDCLSGGPGGIGLELHGVQGFGKEVVAVGGSGGPPAGCAGSLPGAGGAAFFAPGSSLTTLPGTTRGFEASSPVREGQPIVATVTGAPGEVALVAWATGPDPDLDPSLGGFLYLSPPLTVGATGPIGPDGTATFTAPAGLLAPGLEFAHVWFQGATCAAGTCVVAGGSVVTVLDSRF